MFALPQYRPTPEQQERWRAWGRKVLEMCPTPLPPALIFTNTKDERQATEHVALTRAELIGFIDETLGDGIAYQHAILLADRLLTSFKVRVFDGSWLDQVV